MYTNENNNIPQFGFEPQKPFTDYTNPNPVEFKRPVESQTFEQEFTQQPVFNAEPQPFEPVQPMHNDYSHPVYHNSYNNQMPVTPQFQQPYQQPVQPPYQQPVQNNPYQPYQGNMPPYQSAPPMYPRPEQPKANMGLIAIIIVLSVLLVSSLIGILVFVTSNASDNANNNNSFSFTIPEHDYTIPQLEEQATTPPATHEESDYSDRTNKDFGGISLDDKPKDATTNKDYNAETAFNKASQSVVGIVCYSDEITSVEDCDSQGSGIIITSDGYVITNSHVIGNSRTAYMIQVITADGKTYNAGVVGYDTRTDIAVLKMDDAKDLKAASFGDSEKIILGEDIIAIGNPGGLGYQNSITKGIVSAVNRELSSASLVKYIQTDAAINPGNSGGPIVNMYGQVIGIATAKIVSEQFEGMGFAIPSRDTKTIVDSIIKNSYVAGRVKIGISGFEVDSVTASQNDIPRGIQIDTISPNGPCDNTELQAQDIITEVDGQKIESFTDIYRVLEQHKPDDKVKVKYYRPETEKYGETEILLQEDVI